MSNFKNVGEWWNDKSIGLVEIDGVVYALADWNGEKYMNCWICTGEFNMNIADKDRYNITPQYVQTVEENEEDGTEAEFEIVGYDVEFKV